MLNNLGHPFHHRILCACYKHSTIDHHKHNLLNSINCIYWEEKTTVLVHIHSNKKKKGGEMNLEQVRTYESMGSLSDNSTHKNLFQPLIFSYLNHFDYKELVVPMAITEFAFSSYAESKKH